MYKVIERFADLQDNNHKYEVGDVFPRLNIKVSEERIAYLSSKSTKRGRPVIAEVIDPTEDMTKGMTKDQAEDEIKKMPPETKETPEPDPQPKVNRGAKKRSNKK